MPFPEGISKEPFGGGSMKILVIMLLSGLFSGKAWASTSLLSCAPKGGQLSIDKSQYNTYSIELRGPEDPIILFRKGFLGEADQSYIEKETYKPAYTFKQYEQSFAIGYEFMEDKLLIFGGFWKKSEADEQMATVHLHVSAGNTVEPIRKLLEVSEDVEQWQCLVNAKELNAFTANNQADKERLARLERHFDLPKRVTSPGNSSAILKNKVD